MISYNFLQQLALSFPETMEQPHFEKASFRVAKRIFATYDEAKGLACLKLSQVDQDVYSLVDSAHIYAVSNQWGKQGWTYFELNFVQKDVFVEALKAAYLTVAPKKLILEFHRKLDSHL